MLLMPVLIRGQNVIKNFEMVIQHNRRPKLERDLCLDLFSLTFKNIFSDPNTGEGQLPLPTIAPHGSATVVTATPSRRIVE